MRSLGGEQHCQFAVAVHLLDLQEIAVQVAFDEGELGALGIGRGVHCDQAIEHEARGEAGPAGRYEAFGAGVDRECVAETAAGKENLGRHGRMGLRDWRGGDRQRATGPRLSTTRYEI